MTVPEPVSETAFDFDLAAYRRREASMPGILPMKVIKVGSSSQSRVAQACDRCRSKKIRCDGIRPSCSQCTNVGFECKTSDKLSRRAFPRGYTESLEDRVRSLEAEVRELKSLLEEKDEKIDVLSRLQSFSLSSQKANSSPVQTISHSPAGYYPRPPQTSRNDGDDLIYVQ
ncbi:Transcriptional activator protein acu-15, partial [Arthroderma sp. PD_2]